MPGLPALIPALAGGCKYMRQYKTEAVILDTTDIFDADRSFLLFSKELGKIRARARGVRKPTSKLSGHLLTYLPTQLELVESDGWFLVVQAHLLPGYASSGAYPEDSLSFLNEAAVVAEAINRLFLDHDPHQSIYGGLVYTLDRLREKTGRAETGLIIGEFLLKALAELGYQPELKRCVLSGDSISPEFVGWSSEHGGTLSEAGFNRVLVGARRLQSPKSLLVLREMLKPEFLAERLVMPAEVQRETELIVYDYLQTVLGQPLKSLN